MIAYQEMPEHEKILYPSLNIERPVRVLTEFTQSSPDGSNVRLIQKTDDGQLFETGIFDYRLHPDLDGDNHLIVCLSSQVGCERACPFCATGAPKEMPGTQTKVRLIRNLSGLEITSQVVNVVELMHANEETSPLLLSYMGMGEPFDNFENVLTSIHALGMIYTNRMRVTISTICHENNIPKLDQLAQMIVAGEFSTPVKLHFSLHGPDDETRKRLVPQGASVRLVLDTAFSFAQRTHSRVKLNYVLMSGRNDSEGHAQKLAKTISQHPVRDVATVKISQLNPWSGYTSPDQEIFEYFEELLKKNGVSVVQFSSARDGGQVNAGCGQLRKRTLADLSLPH